MILVVLEVLVVVVVVVVVVAVVGAAAAAAVLFEPQPEFWNVSRNCSLPHSKEAVYFTHRMLY